MASIITRDFNLTNAENFENSIDPSNIFNTNLYVLLGKSNSWPTISGVADSPETPYDTTNYKNSILRNGFILKKINQSDIQAVAPRVDWTSGTVYTQYTETANLYLKVTETAVSGGNVNVKIGLANTVNANGINFTVNNPIVGVGDFIKIKGELKEVVRVNTAGDFVQVNSNFAIAASQDVLAQTIYKIVNTSPQYANKFYVRNTEDQVFKCLYNNKSAPSTVKPEITLGGQLPENPYIETSDGYKWKYMYTIPNGLKNRFFNSKYMPVINDNTVYANRKDGRIDIVEVVSGGTGYFSGSTQSNYAIATIVGDGVGATATVDIVQGVITKVNITNGGEGYTWASVVLNDTIQTQTGTPATLKVIISPQYGHGSDSIRELGASDRMISVDFKGNVEGYLPVVDSATGTKVTEYRQVSIVKDPLLSDGTTLATNAIIPTYTKISVETPAAPGFANDQIVYVSSTGNYVDATFTANVLYFDDVESVVYVNNISGNSATIISQVLRQKDTPSIFGQIFSVIPPGINTFSGEIIYVENRAKVIRMANQTDSVKLVVEF
jgi:hypothetical protein